MHAIGDRRDLALRAPAVRDAYLDDRAQVSGVSAHLRSDVDRPVLKGLQPDSYRCFMERTWRNQAEQGVVGLIHPESHFTEARAGGLRRETYRRLRRHWQFRNERRLFEILNTREFGGQHLRSTTAGSGLLERLITVRTSNYRSFDVSRQQRTGTRHQGRRG